MAMTVELSTLRPAVLMRLQLIESLAAHYGSVNRAVLCDCCGLAPAQITRDLALYQAIAPGNLIFDNSTKSYLRSTSFTRIWP
jgi:hypothetical protein